MRRGRTRRRVSSVAPPLQRAEARSWCAGRPARRAPPRAFVRRSAVASSLAAQIEPAAADRTCKEL
eukprot:457084-Prymnesium_polylepis.2